MGAFEYTALDAKGRQRKGVIEGDTPRQVRQALREQGLLPVAVEEVRQKEARARRGPWLRRGISPADLALLTRQLATLVRSGMPVEEALRAVSQQSENPRVKSMVMGVRARVLEGHPLAVALGDFPHVFSELYRTTVAAGEQSGHLDVVLERLADYTEGRQAMRQKLGLALLYPALVTVVAVGVILLLLSYVVPQVVEMFAHVGQELPWLTRALIAVSDFLSSYGLALALALAATLLLARWILAREGPRRRFHRLLLRLPLVGRVVRGMNTARFARTFAILTASGVPVLEGMHLSAQVMTNLPMREAVEAAARRVREGASLKQALEAGGYFPPMTLHLIAAGEASGNLEAMLERAAETQERELETTVAALVGVFEPMMILVMGAVVLVIVLAIMVPILDMNRLVS